MGGNSYIYANNIQNVAWSFRRVGSGITFPRLNIYFHANTNTNTQFIGAPSQNGNTSATGQVMSFTKHANGVYSVWSNLYFYPVANVEAARLANGD
jgi:hypothetical protein